MTPEFIRCEYCDIEIPAEKCELANYRMVIDGKEYIFCCERCARNYRNRIKSNSKK